MSSELRDNKAEQRFEMTEQGMTSWADYRLAGDRLFIDHVESPVPLRGTGASGRLMAALAAEAADDEGQWREPSLLVLGLDSYEANGLAHHFLQAAWLGITADGTPSVHSCVYYRHGSGLGPTWPPRDDDAAHD